MKKLLACLVCVLSTFLLIAPVNADEKDSTSDKKVTAYIFKKEECPFCEKMKAYLEELLKDEEYGQMFELVEYQVWAADWTEDTEMRDLMNNVAEHFGDSVQGAPYLVIGSEYSLNGFKDDFKPEIKEAIKNAYEDEEYTDLVDTVKANGVVKEPMSKTTSNIIGISVTVVILAGLVALVVYSRKEN